ncbi:MAG: ribosome maturation factor RimP [Acidobacteria bacterium]|nr:ribosome maturation factor RimP [Acidobacteriota bacterium]
MELIDRIREMAERVAASEGMELVEVEFHDRGPKSVLRIFLDRPGAVTLRDCQMVSEQISAILDVEDWIAHSYTLEVSSPGLDRKLLKPGDFQRFAGHQVKLVLKAPGTGSRHVRGRLLGIEEETVRVETGEGQVASFAYNEIAKANLVVEFGKGSR